MAMQIQLRRDTGAAWALANPVLADGEIGFCRDLDYLKIGDGVRAWADLPIHAPDVSGAITAAAEALAAAQAAELSAAAVANALVALPAGGGGVVFGLPLVVDPYMEDYVWRSGAHGLGVVPDGVKARMVCKVADIGYAAGDELDLPVGAGTAGLAVVVNSVSVEVRLANITGGIPDRGGASSGGYISSKWKIVVTPFKFS